MESNPAVENLRNDFGWIPELLSNFASNPVFALFLGFVMSLFLWRRQTRLSHDLVKQDELRSLYRQFIRQVEPTVCSMKLDLPMEENKELLELYCLEREIDLVGGAEAIEAAQNVVICVNDLLLQVDGCPTDSNGNKCTPLEKVFSELREFTAVARDDLSE
ncbi:MAG: hypothetical protein AB3N15_07420 [Paracoccaceae bacterium]